jgi:hypothetical protein
LNARARRQVEAAIALVLRSLGQCLTSENAIGWNTLASQVDLFSV